MTYIIEGAIFRRLEIVNISTGEVVHSVDVSCKSERQIERIEHGILMKIDDGHFVRDTATQEHLP